jgi:hypothetical protein
MDDDKLLDKIKTALKKVDSTGKIKDEPEMSPGPDKDDSEINRLISLSNPFSFSSFSMTGLTSCSIPPLTTSQISSLGASSYASMPNYNKNEVLEINGKGADIKINGKSLTTTIEAIEARLAILVPNPKKLEHFEALKKAYDNYKTLEALCELLDEET